MAASRNLGADLHVSRSDDTNIWSPAHRCGGRLLHAACSVLADAGEDLEQPNDLAVGSSDQPGTNPASIPVAFSFRDANPGVRVGALRLRAELGHVCLASDGMGAWRRPLCLRHLRGAPSDDGRRTVLVERDGAAHELCACQFG